MQTPAPDLPPLPPMPHQLPMFLSGDEIARIVLVSVAGAAVILWIIVRGPIGHAIGDVIKRWLGGSRPETAQLDDLNHRLDAIQRQLAEVAERQDFAERMLAQARREKALPSGSDVAG